MVTKERMRMKVDSFIAVDLETTGLQPQKDYIIEIGALKYVDGECVETFSTLVKPPISISRNIYDITGIDDEMVADAPAISDAFMDFLKFVGNETTLLGHNLRFDYSFLKVSAEKMGLPFQKYGLDTLTLARKFLPQLPKKNLETVSRFYDVINPRAHRAFEDAETTAKVYFKILEEFGTENPEHFLPKEMQVKIKKSEPMTARQKNYLLDLLKYHKIQVEAFFDEKGVSIETLTKSQASKIIDGIILQYGRISRRYS